MMRDTNLGDAGCAEVISGLAENTTLTKLDLVRVSHCHARSSLGLSLTPARAWTVVGVSLSRGASAVGLAYCAMRHEKACV